MNEEIKQQFDEMGIEPHEEVLDKCLELALQYNINDATEFVEQWMAFSLSYLQGEDPTPVNLGEFERKVLQVKREKVSAGPKKNIGASALERSTLSAYNLKEEPMSDDEPSVMDDYMSETIKDEPQTPKSVKGRPRIPGDTGTIFSPNVQTPQSAKRAQVVDSAGKSGDVMESFGHPKLLASAVWQTQLEQPLQVTQKLLYKEAPLSVSNFKYMRDLLLEKTELLYDRIIDIGQLLVEKKLTREAARECSWYPQDRYALQSLYAVGMIHSDDDAPLDGHAVLLAVLDSAESNSFLTLNLTRLKSISIFPGQVVMLKGLIPKGDTIIVEEIHSDRKLQLPSPMSVDRELWFVVASGPYTYATDLSYEPLQELLNYLKENKPDVLVLTGPFLDSEHMTVGELTESFDWMTEKMIASIMNVMGSSSTVLLISSQKDATAFPVYPTPPLTLRKTYPNLHLLPDPTLIDLDGITLGVTSTDVVDHLLKHEFAANAGEKMFRVISHLFNQGSFYPICPPPDENMSYDSPLAEKYTQLKQLPNVLILPSDQRHFIRLVNHCLVINPGRLCNNQMSGTFARFLVTPTAPNVKATVFNSMACQIRHI